MSLGPCSSVEAHRSCSSYSNDLSRIPAQLHLRFRDRRLASSLAILIAEAANLFLARAELVAVEDFAYEDSSRKREPLITMCDLIPGSPPRVLLSIFALPSR